VTYSGAVVGATNIKEGLDSVKDTLDNVIIGGGDGTQAAAAAVSVSGTTYTTLKQRVDTEYLETDVKFTVVSEQLADDAKWGWGFFQRILATTTKIKLIGDSITEGVGATGHTVPADNPIIFDNGTEVYREGDYTCRCWANYFREYIGAHYPSINFTNAGIGGKSTRWAMTGTNYQKWVGDNQDLIFVMLGMNDRSLSDFETNITNFLAYVKAHCNNMIVMIPNPTLNDNPSLNVEVRTINDTIIKVCQKNGYFYISHYVDMLKYVENSGTPFETLLQTNGGSHPVDEGYLFMWNNMQNKLKFTSDQATFAKRAKTGYYPFNSHTIDTPITDFAYGDTIEQISVAIAAGFPEAKPGKLKTYRAKEDTDYSYQMFKVYRSNNMYIRRVEFGVFKEFVGVGNIELALNFASGEKPITAYPWGISYSAMQSSSTGVYGLPDNLGGTVVTYRTQATNPYNYQMLYQYSTNFIFSRYVQTDGSWSAWKCMNPTIVITRTLAFASSIAPMGYNGQTATIPVVDTSKNSYIISAKTAFDTSLFPATCVAGTTLYVRLFNAGTAEITPGNLEFDVTINRK
jgi:lysophospholipase L1-like esterase